MHYDASLVTLIALLEQFGNPDSSLIMPDFDLSGELSLKIELHMLRPITEKVHSGNGPVSLVHTLYHHISNFEGDLIINSIMTPTP